PFVLGVLHDQPGRADPAGRDHVRAPSPRHKGPDLGVGRGALHGNRATRRVAKQAKSRGYHSPLPTHQGCHHDLEIPQHGSPGEVERHCHERRRLADYPPQPTGPLVSVIIPARNEAENIARCVRSVLTAAYAPFEVIVVDDRSTDGTGDIVDRLTGAPEAAGRLRLLRGAELPPGWFGKPWAVVQGYRAARGELLLFTDADTAHTPELLPRTVALLEREQVDLVSLLARQEMVSFWERLVQPHVFLALASRVGDLRRVCRTRVVWDAIAAG